MPVYPIERLLDSLQRAMRPVADIYERATCRREALQILDETREVVLLEEALAMAMSVDGPSHKYDCFCVRPEEVASLVETRLAEMDAGIL